jgi:hypothetical protein
MTLMGMSVIDIRPIALVMNITVATLVVVRFSKHDYFSWKLFLPLAIASIPMAYVGGTVDTPAVIIKIVMGLSLLITSVYIFLKNMKTYKLMTRAF